MLNFKRIVCAVAVCAMVATAFGAARRIMAFERFDPEPIAADGMAIINHAQGTNTTIAQVILSDFTPNQQYVVLVAGGSNMAIDKTTFAFPVARMTIAHALIAGDDGSLVADDKGHLTVHLTSADGEGNPNLDSVVVVTFSDWIAREPAPFSTQHIIRVSATGGPIAFQ